MAICRVTQYRVTQVRHVDANLMRPTGFQLHVYRAMSKVRFFMRESAQHAVVGDGTAPAQITDCHLFSVRRMAADRCIDRPFHQRHVAFYYSDVAAMNAPRFELLGQENVRRLRLSY